MSSINGNQIPLNKYEATDYSVSVTKLIARCSKMDDLQRIYSLIHPQHIDVFMKSALINQFGKFPDQMDTIWSIFQSISNQEKDAVIIGTMMNALIINNHNTEALRLYDDNGSLRNDTSHMLAIKAAQNLNDYNRGCAIHQSLMSLSPRDKHRSMSLQLKNTLIDFYGHFRDIESAVTVFETIANHKKDAVTISTMMKCQINAGRPHETLSIYERFKSVTNDVCHVLAIKGCSETVDFRKGHGIYTEVERSGKRQSIQLRNTMIDFYGRFGRMEDALQIFDAIDESEKDSITLNVMMTALMEHNRESEAMSLYDKFEKLRDDTSDLLAVKSCIALDDRQRGIEVIRERIGDLKKQRVEVQNTLIDFYGHFRDIKSALSIYNAINEESREIVMVNAMMKALINNEDSISALRIYDQYEAIHDAVSHLTAIKGCIATNDFEKGLIIHQRVESTTDIFILSALVDFYGAFGEVERAQEIFGTIQTMNRVNTVCVNAMMKAFLKNGYNEEVLALYDEYEALRDDISYLSALNACIGLDDYQRGKAIHDSIEKIELQVSVEVENMLIEFYGHFGDVDKAQSIFDAIPPLKKDVISINSMMTVHLESDQAENALTLYDDTVESTSNLTDDISHLLALRGCIRTADYDRGQKIHHQITGYATKSKERGHSINLKNTLIDFYGHFFEIEPAKEIYESIPEEEKTIVTVGAMMEAFCNCYMNMECIELFEAIPTMKGLTRSTICYSIAIKACTQATAYHLGKDIHDRLKVDDENKEMLADPAIQINLIDFYAKCGSLETSQAMFDEIEDKDISVWNAMMKAYGRNGDIENAVRIYDKMQEMIVKYGDNDNVLKPNCKTFTILLNACNHSGNVVEAMRIWNEEIDDDEFKYDSYVIATLVDCFGRRGMLEEAQTMVIEYEKRKGEEHPNDATMWKSLLNGCKLHQDAHRAEEVYQEMQKRLTKVSEADMAAASVMLSNVYVSTVKDGPLER